MKRGFFTTSDMARIYYEDRGEGDPILFVPGHMCTTKFFERNASALEKTNRVICMDNRGFGSSSKPLHGNDVRRHAEDIKELIDFLELDNVMLLGWSLSGSIVTLYAHMFAGWKLKGIGLVDACLFPFSPEEWNSYTAKNYNMDEWNRKYSLWHTDIAAYVNNFVARMDRYLSTDEIQTIKDEIVKTPPWIGFALHSDWCHTDAEALLKELTVPVLIVSGESKGHGYAMGRHYYEEIRTYRELHEFDKGGHLLFYVESEKFNRILLEFMREISTAPRKG